MIARPQYFSLSPLFVLVLIPIFLGVVLPGLFISIRVEGGAKGSLSRRFEASVSRVFGVGNVPFSGIIKFVADVSEGLAPSFDAIVQSVRESIGNGNVVPHAMLAGEESREE